MSYKYVFLLPVLLAALAPAAPPPDENLEMPEMVTDRPDFTESTEVVPSWMFQIEGGLAWSREGSNRTFSGPNSLLRLGMTRRLELRFGAEGFLRESVYDPGEVRRQTGFSDFGVGAKVRLASESRLRPAVSLIPSLSLPAGSRHFTSTGYDPSLGVAWSKGLPLGFDTGGNVNFASVSEGNDRFFQHAWSLTSSHALFSGLRGYCEVYRIRPQETTVQDLWMFNGGLTKSLGRNAQLDVAAGRSLHSLAPSWFVSAGFAVRAPWRPRAIR